MNKYIDANLLRKEIERLRGQNNELLQQAPSIGREFLFGISGAYSDVLKIIDSLQQEMWEPTEEQIKALKLAYEDAFECPEGCVPHMPLKSLLSDLQKLL